jgi:hypothetical protein
LVAKDEGERSLDQLEENNCETNMDQNTSGNVGDQSLLKPRGTGKYWLAIGIEALVIIILSSMLSFEYSNSPFFQAYVNSYVSTFGGLAFWNLITITFVFATAYYAIQKQVFKD